ncbi:MAG: CHAT domain-containing protein [Armatimonadetes bacterium]|nr:CHAT domain-containing protein [Armatimonadota bacterium]
MKRFLVVLLLLLTALPCIADPVSPPPHEQDALKKDLLAYAEVLLAYGDASRLVHGRKYAEGMAALLEVRKKAMALARYPRAAAGTWQYERDRESRLMAWKVNYDVMLCLEYEGKFEESLKTAPMLLGPNERDVDRFDLARVHHHMAYAYEGLGQLEKSLREMKIVRETVDAAAEELLRGAGTWGDDAAGARKAGYFLTAVWEVRNMYYEIADSLAQIGRYEEVIALLSGATYVKLCETSRTPQTMALWKKVQGEEVAMAAGVLARQQDILATAKIGSAWLQIGRDNADRAAYEKALHDFEAALAMTPDNAGWLHIAADMRLRMADVLQASRRWDEAEKQLALVEAAIPNMAEDWRDHLRGSLGWRRAVLLLDRPTPDPAAARALLEDAVARKASPVRLLQGLLQGNLGRAHEALGDLKKAAECYREAIHAVETQRAGLAAAELKETFFRRNQHLYEDLARALHKAGRDGEAVAVMEQVRARSLADLLSQVPLRKGLSARTQAALAEVRRTQRMATAARVPGRARSGAPEVVTARRTFMDALRDAPELSHGATAETVRPEAVSALLDRDTVLLEYLIGERFAAVAVIAPGQPPQIVELTAPVEEMRAEISALRRAVDGSTGIPARGRRVVASGQQPLDWRQSAARLYDMLLAPVEAHLRGKKRVVVVPFDELNYLPWAVLGREKMLIDRMSVCVLPSATVLKFCRAKKRAAGSEVVAFGLGNVARNGFSALPNTLYELKAISGLRPGTRAFAEERFRRNVVQREAPGRRFVHFATHGFLDGNEPSGSGIVTADGVLTVRDIFNLDLSADLVVLSACQTGLGKVYRGDEVVGLVRAFMYAGTPSVLATLWSVADDSTARFMEQYYQRLGKMDKAQALRQAQVALRKQYAHPYYWAPFVLIGDWK